MARRRTFGQLLRKGSKWAIRIVDPSAPRIPGQRPRTIVRTIGSRKDAEAALRDIREAQIRGTFVLPPRPEDAAPGAVLTLAGAVGEYAAASGREGAAARTVKVYTAAARRVAASPVGDLPLAAVTVKEIERFLDWRRTPADGKAPGPGTLALDLAVLSATFARLVRRGDIKENPVRLLRRPKSPESPRAALNDREVDLLLRAAGPRTRPLILAGLLTGARFSELAALRWSDVDLVAGTLAVRRKKNRTAAVLPLHPRLADALVSLRAAKAREGGIPSTNDPVFTSAAGGPLTSPGKGWARALRDAGLEGRRGVSFHSLRHSFATAFLAGGGNVRDLQHVLGHSSLVITERYTKANDARVREGVLRLGAGVRMEATGAAEMRSGCDPLPLPDASTEGAPSQLCTGTWDATASTVDPLPGRQQNLVRPGGPT